MKVLETIYFYIFFYIFLYYNLLLVDYKNKTMKNNYFLDFSINLDNIPGNF